MTLNEYMIANGIKAKDASHDLRIDRRYIGYLLKEKSRPSLDLVDRIAVWSKFAVMANDWMRVGRPEASKRKGRRGELRSSAY